MFFGVDGTYRFVKKTGRDCENRKLSPFWETFLRQSLSSTPKTPPKGAKIVLFRAWSCRVTIGWKKNNQISLSIFIFHTFRPQYTNVFLSISKDVIEWSLEIEPDSVILTDRSRPQNDNNLTRNSFGSPELVVVSRTGFFEQASSEISFFPQPGRDYGEEVQSGLKCSCKIWTQAGVRWLIWTILISTGEWLIGCRPCLLTGNWHAVFPNSPCRFEDGSISRKPH